MTLNDFLIKIGVAKQIPIIMLGSIAMYELKIDMLTNTDELEYNIESVHIDLEHKIIEIGIK